MVKSGLLWRTQEINALHTDSALDEIFALTNKAVKKIYVFS